MTWSGLKSRPWIRMPSPPFVHGTGSHYDAAPVGEVGPTPKAITSGRGRAAETGLISARRSARRRPGGSGSSMHQKVELTELATEFRKSYVEAFGKARSITSPGPCSTDSLLPPTPSIAPDRWTRKEWSKAGQNRPTVTRGRVTFGTEKGGLQMLLLDAVDAGHRTAEQGQVGLFPAEGATGNPTTHTATGSVPRPGPGTGLERSPMFAIASMNGIVIGVIHALPPLVPQGRTHERGEFCPRLDPITW